MVTDGLIGCGRRTFEIAPGREHERPASGSRRHGPRPIEASAGVLEGREERLGLVEPPESHERLDLIGDDAEVGGLPNAHRLLEFDGPGQERIGLGGSAQGKLEEPQDRQVRDQEEDLAGRLGDPQPLERCQPRRVGPPQMGFHQAHREVALRQHPRPHAESLEGRYAAFALYRALVERHPEHAPAVYAYGRILVQGGDAQGVALVERAMALDPEAAQPGAELLFEFYRGRKDVSGMDRWQATLETLGQVRAKAHAELTRFDAKDRLRPHGFSPATLQRLVEAIGAQKKIKRAWLVRKSGTHLPKVPGYLLLLEFAWTSHLTGGRDDALRAVLDKFAADEDGFVTIRDAAESRRLRKAVAAVPEALAFERG